MNRRKRRRIPSLTYYVCFSLAVLLVYTITELTLSHITGTTDDTLTTCFFSCFGGEVLMAALIKIYKLKEKKDEE